MVKQFQGAILREPCHDHNGLYAKIRQLSSTTAAAAAAAAGSNK